LFGRTFLVTKHWTVMNFQLIKVCFDQNQHFIFGPLVHIPLFSRWNRPWCFIWGYNLHREHTVT
jgi:hypothetical protein